MLVLFHPKITLSTSTLRPLGALTSKKKKKKTGKSCSQKNPILSTHVEKEDLEAFLTSPGAADEAMSLLDVDGDGR